MSWGNPGEPLTLRTNLADYPVTMAIKDGRTSSALVTLDCCGPKSAHNGFKPMLRENAYDCGELAIVTYLQAKTYGKPWVMLPVPVLGRFQHHCAGYNSECGDLAPKDIEGREVGVRSYAQTTGLWVRGILQHEYGVDLDTVTWVTSGDGHLAEYTDPSNCRRAPAGKAIPEMMLAGEVAAALLGNEMPRDERVRTLIPNPHEAAAAWFEREGLVPINHVFVVPQSLSEARPDVVAEIYRMLAEARELAPPEALRTHPPIGVEANRKGLELAVQWSLEQNIIPAPLAVDDLFDARTATLGV